MYFMRHTIADIAFVTQSDVELKSLQNNWFDKFTRGDMEPDVYHRIIRVENKDLTLPLFDKIERDHILECHIEDRLGPGNFILPPFIRNTENSISDFQCIQTPLDVSLLRSPLIRERLSACLDYPREVGLILHAFSVTIFDYRSHRIDLFYHSDQQWIFENVPLDNGFRRMFSSFLPFFSAVMLHSSGVIRNNRGALFFASDEGGKSTVLSNLINGTILCDDRNIIRKSGDAFTVYSTPWGQNNNGPQQATLGGLFLIEKAQDFELSLVKPRDMITFLWYEHMQFWRILPKSLRIMAFELIADICFQVPCYRMRFPKHFVDWNAIDKVIQN